jgi:Bacterial protein of unknown function (DUF922)
MLLAELIKGIAFANRSANVLDWRHPEGASAYGYVGHGLCSLNEMSGIGGSTAIIKSALEQQRWIFVPKCVFILLLGAAATSRGETLHEPPWKEEMAKGCFPYHHLAVSDFPVNDNLHPEFGMYTRVFFHYEYNHRWSIQNAHVVDRVTRWLVWSGFDQNKSSRKSWFKLGDEALPHEQGHLDINELYSRRLAEISVDKLPRGEGADPKEASGDLRRKMEALADRVSAQARKEHDQYDAETAHGKNLSKQREWSAAIQTRLERAGIHF